MEEAEKSVSTVIKAQESDGSWVYGKLPFQNWKDSFHTGFVLECLNDYMKWTGDNRFVEQLEIGTRFYLDNFFTEQGVPKYYDQGSIRSTFIVSAAYCDAQQFGFLARKMSWQKSS